MIVWVAAYPKSGNTFLRILLSDYLYGDLNEENVFKGLNKIGKFPTLFKYNELVNEKIIENKSELKNINYLYKYSLYLQKKLFFKELHFLKTHSSNFNINKNVFTNHEITSCAIYLVRDPRNVLLSYSDYQNTSLENTLNQMEREVVQYQKHENDWYPITHLGSWKSNIVSWQKSQVLFPVKIIKYEDLILNTYDVFYEILRFLNKHTKIDIVHSKINLTIKRAEFNNLKKLEERGFFPEMDHTNNKNLFFNQGKERDWKKNLNLTNFDTIQNIFEKEIKLFGY